jgi:hypothetical protein
MNIRRRILIATAVLLAASAGAQRNFTISAISNGPGSVIVSWPVQSATPAGDLLMLPQFQVQRSVDLKSWIPLGAPMSGTLHQTLTLADPNGVAAFYRVQSIISQEYGSVLIWKKTQVKQHECTNCS